MVKRLTSLLLLSLLLGTSIIQAQGAFLRHFSSFKVPGVASLVAISVASVVAYSELYKQKNDDLLTYKTMKDRLNSSNNKSLQSILQAQGCKNKSELRWAARYDLARAFDLERDRLSLINEFNVSINHLESISQTEEIKSLVRLYSSLRDDFSSKTDELLVPKFQARILQQLVHVRKESRKLALTDQRKIKLEKRATLMSNVMRQLAIYDFARNLGQKRTEKLEELNRKIAETPRARDRLWIVPTMLNCFTTIFAGLTYLGSRA